VTNNGTISGTSTGGGVGIGIDADTPGNVITNNGRITGTTFAIFFHSDSNTLTLAPTSIINGKVFSLLPNNLLQLGGSGVGT
jgi:hypothetical protein